MNIGELFVSLGLKGNEKTLSGITGAKHALKDTASEALAAKAAIVGAMYALERLFASSGKAGTDLTNFNALMGGGANALQRYQHIAKQVGSSNEEMAGTFKRLSEISTNILIGKGAPESAMELARIVGKYSDVDAHYREAMEGNAEPLFKDIDLAAKLEPSRGIRSKMFKDFGISDNIGAGMVQNKFSPEALANAPTYSDKELKSLADANAAWERLGVTIQMAIGHFNSKHGNELVGEITKVVKSLVNLSEKFVKLSESAKLFDKLTMVFTGWGLIFDGITAAVKDINDLAAKSNDKAPVTDAVLGGAEPEKKGYKERIENALLGAGQGEGLVSILIDAIKDGLTAKEQPKTGGAAIIPTRKPGDEVPSAYRLNPKTIAPVMPQNTGANTAPAQDVTVNQTLNFQHDGTDVVKNKSSIKDAARAYFRQSSAAGRGT